MVLDYTEVLCPPAVTADGRICATNATGVMRHGMTFPVDFHQAVEAARALQ